MLFAASVAPAKAGNDSHVPLDDDQCRDGDAIVYDAATQGLRCVSDGAAKNQAGEAPCAGTPAPGTVCADGSIYAGVSPDGDVKMFTTPEDAPGTYFWNNGSEWNFTDTDIENCITESPGEQSSCQTGKANTALLVELSDPSAPYAAAYHCGTLTAFGHSDWYLPAADELNVLFLNRVVIGGFNTEGAWYWSSSESSSGQARMQRFIVGGQDYGSKDSLDLVRCVRKESAPR